MASVFNTTNTISGRVARILTFLEASSDFYVAIGKSTPWDGSFGQGISDINPPTPTPQLGNIPEPIIYKRVHCATPASKLSVCLDSTETSAICPTTGEEINFNFNAQENPQTLLQQSFVERRYTFFDPADIILQDGVYNILPEVIYVQASISGTEYNEVGWRASALFTKLFLADGVPEGQDLYTPTEVIGGLPQQITYNTLIERQTNKSHRFEYIITV